MRPPRTNLQVVVRVRPPNDREAKKNSRNIIQVIDDRTIIFDPADHDSNDDFHLYRDQPPKTRHIHGRARKVMPMAFDHVYAPQTTNAEIFADTMNEMIATLLDGHNCCAFVYGATGAGKTFTMLGNANDCHPGVAQMTVEHLFEQMQIHQNERKFEMAISYLEVYNEQIRNLLADRKHGDRLKLQEINKVTVVCGLRLIPIANVAEMMALLMHGNRNRTQHPTDSNAESSRSHAIFQIFMRMQNRQSGERMSVKMSLIDLAGSERAVGFKCNGARLEEGANINRSLLALGNCINKLADGGAHIPYRDSNLTRIIKDSLGGNCQTLMIANVSPSLHAYEDTYNTLKYAMRAKKIRINVNMKTNRSKFPKSVLMKKIAEQQTTIGRLEAEVKALNDKLVAKETLPAIAPAIPMNNDAMPVEWLRQISVVLQKLRQATDLAISRERINLSAKVKSSVVDLRRLAAIQCQQNSKDTNLNAQQSHPYETMLQLKANEVFRMKTQLIEKESDLKKLIRKISKSELEGQLKPLMALKNNLTTVGKSIKCYAKSEATATPTIPISLSELYDIEIESEKLLQDINLLARCTNKVSDKSFDRNAEFCTTNGIDDDEQQIKNDIYLTDIDAANSFTDLNAQRIEQSTYRMNPDDITTSNVKWPDGGTNVENDGNGNLTTGPRISKLKEPKDYRKRTPKTSSSRKTKSKFPVKRNM